MSEAGAGGAALRGRGFRGAGLCRRMDAQACPPVAAGMEMGCPRGGARGCRHPDRGRWWRKLVWLDETMQDKGSGWQVVTRMLSGGPGQRWGRMIALVALVLVAGWLGLFPTPEPEARGPQPESAQPAGQPAEASRRSPAAEAASGASRLAEIDVQALPPEARETLALIRKGGPYPYEKDGTVFGNREGLLPRQRRGYYTEYTVTTPRVRHRGARRIVAGGRDGQYTEFFYTDDHYQSFRRIRMP